MNEILAVDSEPNSRTAFAKAKHLREVWLDALRDPATTLKWLTATIRVRMTRGQVPSEGSRDVQACSRQKHLTRHRRPRHGRDSGAVQESHADGIREFEFSGEEEEADFTFESERSWFV